MNVSDALDSRTSVRAFLEKPVPGDVVKDILLGASRSPPAAIYSRGMSGR